MVNGTPSARFASASRMIAAIGAPGPASMNCTRPKGCFSTSEKVRSSWIGIDAVRAFNWPPMDVPFIHRASDATTSRVVTVLPSWNFSPERSVNV